MSEGAKYICQGCGKVDCGGCPCGSYVVSDNPTADALLDRLHEANARAERLTAERDAAIEASSDSGRTSAEGWFSVWSKTYRSLRAAQDEVERLTRDCAALNAALFSAEARNSADVREERARLGAEIGRLTEKLREMEAQDTVVAALAKCFPNGHDTDEKYRRLAALMRAKSDDWGTGHHLWMNVTDPDMRSQGVDTHLCPCCGAKRSRLNLGPWQTIGVTTAEHVACRAAENVGVED